MHVWLPKVTVSLLLRIKHADLQQVTTELVKNDKEEREEIYCYPNGWSAESPLVNAN